jgi:GNAT superfamily N-acetyltransferase
MWEVPTAWPDYMRQDPVGLFHQDRITDFAAHQLLFLDGERLIGHALSVPFRWDEPFEDLPPRGFDEVVERGVKGLDEGAPANVVAAIEVDVDPAVQGSGVSSFAVEALADNARSLGFLDLVVPVRPNGKHREPHVPLADYVARHRDDGLPEDPWLRVHVRRGARVLAVAPTSMTIVGTLEQWRKWTDLPFDRSGDLVVPGALVPVHVSLEHGYAVYVEPNVWVHHDLR